MIADGKRALQGTDVSTLAIHASEFSKNTILSGTGAAIDIAGVSSGVNATFTDSTFEENAIRYACIL